MRAILKVAGIMLLIYIVSLFSGISYVFSGGSGFMMLSGISFVIYILLRNISKPIIKANETIRPKKSNSVIDKNPVAGTAQKWIYLVFAVIVPVYFFRELLSMLGFRFFLFMDNLLHLTESVHPVVMWSVLGLFTGLVYGSFVTWKKYKLDFKLNLIPIGILSLIIVILLIVNKPRASKPVTYATMANNLSLDSNSMTMAKQYIINKWEVANVKSKNSVDSKIKKTLLKSVFDFRKNGKGFILENGINKDTFFYTLSSDGKTLLLTDSKKFESKPIQIISITRGELVITSEIFKNDTVIFKSE